MYKAVGNYLERYLNGLLEYNEGINGDRVVTKKRLGQLKHRYDSTNSGTRLAKRLYEEGIELQSIKFDPAHSGFQLFTTILKSASDYFCNAHNLDLKISEEELDNEMFTSFIFKENGIRDTRILFDAYTNFLKKPEKYTKFIGPLLNECFDPFIELQKHELGTITLEEFELDRLESIINNKSEIVTSLIEKQGLKIYGASTEKNKIYLDTDMFQEEAEKIKADLNMPIEIHSYCDEGEYVTKLTSDIDHAHQLVTISDVYVNLINPRQ